MRRLLISSVIGRLPMGTAGLAILFLVRAYSHSYAASGIAVGAMAVAEAAVAPLVGRSLDRFGAVRLVFPAALLQAATLVTLAIVARGHSAVAVLVLLSGVIGATMPPVAPAVRAIWPRLLKEPNERAAAFSLDATGQELAWTTGPVVVGVVSGAVSPEAAVYMVAALTLVTGAWFSRVVAALNLTRAETADRTAGLRNANQVTRLLLPVALLFGVALGGLEVGIPALASHLDHASLGGVLLALWSVGSMIGGVSYGLRTWQVAPERALALLLFGSALLIVPLTLSAGLPSAMVASAIGGLCGAPIFSSLSSLIGEYAPAHAAAEAFTLNSAAIISGVAAGSALAGVVVSLAGVAAAIGIAGAFCVAAGLVALKVSTPKATDRPTALQLTPERVDALEDLATGRVLRTTLLMMRPGSDPESDDADRSVPTVAAHQCQDQQ